MKSGKLINVLHVCYERHWSIDTQATLEFSKTLSGALIYSGSDLYWNSSNAVY